MRIPWSPFAAALIFTGPLGGQQCPSGPVGLVLSGGGAKGFAHIGVLQSLDSLGVHPDLVVGASIGSIFGALYSTGFSGRQIDSIARELPSGDPGGLASRVPHDWGTLTPLLLWEQGRGGFSLVTRGSSELRTNAVLNRILFRGNLIARGDFDRLPIPFRAVATDLRTREAVALAGGDLAQAVRASIAIPLVYTPERVDDRYFVDGGISANLPIEAARAAGARRVIVVDLKDDPARSDSAELSSPASVAGRLASFLFTQPMAALGPDDIYIKPDVHGVSNLDFQSGNRDRLIRNGRLAADSILRHAACLPQATVRAAPPLPTHLGSLQVVDGSARDGETLRRILGLVRNQPLDVPALEAQLVGAADLEAFNEIWLGPVGVGDTVDLRSVVVPAARRVVGFGVAYDHDLGGRLWLGALDRYSLRGLDGSAVLALGRFESDLTATLLTHIGVGHMSLTPLASIRLASEDVRQFTPNGANFARLQAREASAFGGFEWARLGAWRIRVGGRLASWRTPAGETRSTGGAVVSARLEPGRRAHGSVEVVSTGDYQLARAALGTAVRAGRLSLAAEGRMAAGRRLPLQHAFELGGNEGFPGLQLGERRGDREVYLRMQSAWQLRGPVALRMLLAAGRSANGGSLFEDEDWLAGVRFGLGATTLIGPVAFEYGVASNGHRAAFIRVGQWF